MYMKFKDGKAKVLTLSYDDGVVQDIRLIEIMNKYGLKGTFNISSGLYIPEDTVRERYYGRMKLSEAKELYTNSGHEVAIHAYTHPYLDRLDTTEIISEIIEDRRGIEKDYGTLARGMAYPYGAYNDTIIDILEKCGICYSRTVKPTENFDLPKKWLELNPTCHHNHPRLMELAKNFAENTPRPTICWMFYLWGHSYEFDNDDNWDVIERFAEQTGGHDEIWYATNIEIYDYVKAYERLEMSFDKKLFRNPSAVDVWFEHRKEVYCVPAGKGLEI